MYENVNETIHLILVGRWFSCSKYNMDAGIEDLGSLSAIYKLVRKGNRMNSVVRN